MAIDAAAIAFVQQEFVKKIGQPWFDEAGKLSATFAQKVDLIITDALNHSHHQFVKEFFGKDLIIDEVAVDFWAHKLELVVIWSPGNKMPKDVFTGSANSAAKAREKALSCIEAQAKYFYASKR